MSTMPSLPYWAQALKNVRESQGKKRQETADEIGISRASLEYYEKGKRKPNIEMFVKIAEYYGVSIDHLVGVDTSHSDLSALEISQYTGLSLKTVEALHKIKSGELNRIANFILTHLMILDVLVDDYNTEKGRVKDNDK